MSDRTLQIELMKKLKGIVGKDKFVRLLGKSLAVSRSTAFRYSSGKTAISIDEINKLCNDLEVPLENLFPKRKGQVLVNMASVDEPFEKAEDYPLYLLKMVMYINSLPNSRITYLTSEVGVPYYFDSSILMSFKMYVWGRNTFRQEEHRNAKFQPNLMLGREGVKDIMNQMNHYYKKIERKEIWTSNILNRTFSQIRYCKKMELFHDLGIVEEIIKELRIMLRNNLVDDKYRNGKDKNRKVYYQPFFSGEDIVLIESDKEERLISTFFNPDYFISDDPRLIASSRNRLEDFISSSRFLDDEESRLTFFNKLNKKMDAFLDELWDDRNY